jgi:hypothetical protein
LNVVGVYFAWSGDSLKIPIVNTLTFWDRKRVAERIASNGDCLDAIEQLSQAARIHEKSYIFLIGHSFGGLILERTVEHTLRTLQGQQVKPPWDLALILNPASDSVLVRQLVRDLESLYRYDPRPVPDSPLKWAGRYEPRSGGDPISENQPTIVELQSENDSATGLTFPIGSSLGVFVAGEKNSAEYGGNARVPFWIVRVPSQIIDNHGGIWSDNNMALMAAIFRMHRPIKKQLITVSGHTVIKETVPVPAKSYVLPARPEFRKQK